MYQMLFTRLALSGSGTSEVSQSVSMAEANAAQLDMVVINISGSGAQVACQLQESNDLENWVNKGSATNLTAVGFSLPAAQTAIASGYVRLKVTLTGTSPVCVVSAGVNTKSL